MHRIPYALAALTALSLLVPAHATPCPLLTDPAGDGHLNLPGFLVGSPQFDILSGDVASGATTVAGELRVASLAPDLAGRPRNGWHLMFVLGSTRYAFATWHELSGAYTTMLYENGTPLATTVVLTVDVPNGVLRWEAPRSAFAPLATPGTTFHSIAATTASWVVNADAATTTETYVDQDPGCIAAA